MARGINKCILVGNCTKDAETRYMPSGAAVTSISVATNESWIDKQSGQKQERAEYHNVTFFGKLAEIAGEYLKKGSQVYIEGKLRTESYEKDGITRYTTKIIANEMQMLGSRSGSESGNRQDQANQQSQPQGGHTDDAFDDDIPFSYLGKEYIV